MKGGRGEKEREGRRGGRKKGKKKERGRENGKVAGGPPLLIPDSMPLLLQQEIGPLVCYFPAPVTKRLTETT